MTLAVFPPPPAPESERTAVDTLARTIYGEARGQTVRGMEAVAAVVMNRVRSAERRGGYWWGNTVTEVCRKPYQFSCWNRDDPNLPILLGALPGDPAFDCALRIARRAVAGTLGDPTGGATHYHAKTIRPHWAEGKTPSTAIGDHLFYDDID